MYLILEIKKKRLTENLVLKCVLNFKKAILLNLTICLSNAGDIPVPNTQHAPPLKFLLKEKKNDCPQSQDELPVKLFNFQLPLFN